MSERPDKITRQDLEQSFLALQRDLTGATEERKSYLVAGGIASGVIALVVAYLFGRRKGRRLRSRRDD
jgi:type IV secretory pathway ATPase VirB11/archaellum biosynthesis ATPase